MDFEDLGFRRSFKKSSIRGSSSNLGIPDLLGEPSESTLEIPITLSIEYSIEYDITQADKIIREKLRRVGPKIKHLIRKLDTANTDLDNATKVVTINSLVAKIESLQKELTELTEIYTLKNYILETGVLLSDFDNLPETRKIINLMNSIQPKLTASEIQKQEIIDKYLEIAKKYMSIRIDKPEVVYSTFSNSTSVCLSCLESIIGNIYDSQGHLICQCGAENKVKHIENTSGKDYDVLANLVKSIKRDACIQLIGFDVDLLLQELNDYFRKQGKPVSDYYQGLKLNRYGRKEGTNQDIIIEAMDKLGYNDYYKDYLYICHRFFGWERLDVLKYLGKIREHFLATQLVWDTKMTPGEKDRSSSLPVEYRKLQHYRLVGVNFPRSHFKLPEKPASMQEYDRIWKIMCDRSNHPEIKFEPAA